MFPVCVLQMSLTELSFVFLTLLFYQSICGELAEACESDSDRWDDLIAAKRLRFLLELMLLTSVMNAKQRTSASWKSATQRKSKTLLFLFRVGVSAWKQSLNLHFTSPSGVSVLPLFFALHQLLFQVQSVHFHSLSPRSRRLIHLNTSPLRIRTSILPICAGLMERGG